MRLEWLEDILAVADTGSFSEAAERRHLTPSAFSRRIQQIEDALGVDLFDRSRKPIQLLPTTEMNKEEIGRLAGGLRQLGYQLQRGSRLAGNRLVMASQHALTTSFTPRLLQGVHHKHPELYLRLRSANSEECFNMLLTRQADIVFLYERAGETMSVETHYLEHMTVGEDRLIPVYSAREMAGLNENFNKGTLPIIAYPSDVFLGRVMNRTILPRVRAQIDALPRAETALTVAAVELASTGVGVAWIPKSLAERGLAAGDIKDLSGTLPSCTLMIAAMRLNEDQTMASSLMWSHLKASNADVSLPPARDTESGH